MIGILFRFFYVKFLKNILYNISPYLVCIGREKDEKIPKIAASFTVRGLLTLIFHFFLSLPS